MKADISIETYLACHLGNAVSRLLRPLAWKVVVLRTSKHELRCLAQHSLRNVGLYVLDRTVSLNLRHAFELAQVFSEGCERVYPSATWTVLLDKKRQLLLPFLGRAIGR